MESVERQLTSIETSAQEALILEDYPEDDRITRLKPRTEFSGVPPTILARQSSAVEPRDAD